MQHFDLGVQFMKPCIGSERKMGSPNPCLNKLVASHETQKCCSVRFLCSVEELTKSVSNGLGCDLQLGIKRKSSLGLKNQRLRWITGIIFQLQHPSLLGAMSQKLLYSLISIISVLFSLNQCNIWIKGSNL